MHVQGAEPAVLLMGLWLASVFVGAGPVRAQDVKVEECEPRNALVLVPKIDRSLFPG